MALNKLAELKDAKTGETVCQVFGPPNALTSGDALSQGLYGLSELIIRGLLPDDRGGGLGGEFGYGANFENDVFMMHRFCWCESEEGDCLWCIPGDHPDFGRLLGGRFGNEDGSTPYDYSRHQKRHYYDAPHFWYKPSNFRVSWYKWIGRDMATNRDIRVGEWADILRACFDSIAPEAHERAAAQYAHEQTPQYRVEQEEAHRQMRGAIARMFEEEEG